MFSKHPTMQFPFVIPQCIFHLEIPHRNFILKFPQHFFVTLQYGNDVTLFDFSSLALQGIVCLSNNTCNERAVTDELSGALTGFQTTYVEQLVNDTANFLANDTNRDLIERVIKEVEKVNNAVEKVQSIKEPLGDLLGMY